MISVACVSHDMAEVRGIVDVAGGAGGEGVAGAIARLRRIFISPSYEVMAFLCYDTQHRRLREGMPDPHPLER